MNQEITIDDYGNISCFRSIPTLLKRLAPLMDKVSYMTAEGTTTNNLRSEFDEKLNGLALQMKTWAPIIQTPFGSSGIQDEVLDAVKGTFDIASYIIEEDVDANHDTHDIADVDKFELEYRQLVAFGVLFSLSSDRYPCNIFKKVYHHLLCKYFETLNALIDVFNLNQEMLSFPGLKIPLDMKFTIHDHPVFLTKAEREAKQRAEEEQARIAAQAEALKKAKEAVSAHAKVILDAYNQQKSLGNLKKLTFVDNVTRLLENPESISECQSVEALYSFLMCMSCSKRYMPGEHGDDFDRIMGSFMELENDVLSYNENFQMYMGEFDLTHSKVVEALSLFDSTEGKIAAQYIDTKEYIDSIDPEKDHSRASFHIFRA